MATIMEVATAAGVAPSTVSYVLSGKRSISEATRRRVEETIRRLGYCPHNTNRLTNLLALSVPLRAEGTMPFVTAAIRAARAHEHDLLLLTDDQGADGIRRMATTAIADALIVLDAGRLDHGLPVLRSLDRPVVLVGAPARPCGLTCVDLDLVAAGSAGVGRLADLGHRQVALIGSPGPLLDGFSTTVARRGLRAIVRESLQEVLRQQPETTGLVVPDEAALASVLVESRRHGLRVPADISVVAVGSDAFAELGAAAVDIAVSQLNGHAQPALTLLPATLTERAGTPPPAGRD